MSVEESLYQEIIIDHWRATENRRRLEQSDRQAGGANPSCGDEVELYARIDDNRLIEMSYMGGGCSICCASANMLCEALDQQSLDTARQIAGAFRAMLLEGAEPRFPERADDLAAMRGVRDYPVRIKCALLAWSALADMIGP